MRSAHVMGIMVLHRELGQEKLSWPLAHQATVNQDNAVASVTAIYSLIICFWYVSNMSESKAANHVASDTRLTRQKDSSWRPPTQSYKTKVRRH